jgi:dihydroorotate dehydrogenase
MIDLYSLFRPLLFAADPETAHAATFKALDTAARLGIAQALAPKLPADPVTVMGITFPNRVGLAAGLDKNAEHLVGLSTLGFGFIEAGTVTPRPQPGNPKPRLFRLPEAEALINRMGFNNVGVERFVENVKRSGYRGILGVNLGKNFDTPNERAADDYVIALRAVYSYASYATINISSPNTKGLRDLQSEEALAALLGTLQRERDKLANAHGRVTPMVVKIAPDLTDDAIAGIARRLIEARVDGVIATNTTLARDAVEGLKHANEAGGLSGRPLRAGSNEVIRTLAKALDGALPIIGVGGILDAQDARDKLSAGAALVQIYTGLIYRGPALVRDAVEACATR